MIEINGRKYSPNMTQQELQQLSNMCNSGQLPKDEYAVVKINQYSEIFRPAIRMQKLHQMTGGKYPHHPCNLKQ